MNRALCAWYEGSVGLIVAGSLDCWYGSFTLTGLDLASWCPLLSMGARVIDIVARYRVFRSLLLSRLACVVYSFISQSLTVLALIDRDVTFFQGRNSVALVGICSYRTTHSFCCIPSILSCIYSIYQPYKLSQLFL